MKPVRVRPHRRSLPYDIRFLTEVSAVQDLETGKIHHRIGGVHRTGRINIYLGSTVMSLEARALELGRELKEAHVRDDVIETIIHENTHRAIYRVHGIVPGGQVFGLPWKPENEEKVIDRITQEVMKRIREEPRLEVDPQISSKLQAKKSRGMLKEV
jgi:hypothetical protein